MFKPFLNRAFYLAVVLSSASAFAATPVEPASETLRSQERNIPRQESAYRNAENPGKSDIKRVYKDDYERHLVTVSRPRNTDMVWLRKNRTDPSQKSNMIWIGKKRDPND